MVNASLSPSATSESNASSVWTAAASKYRLSMAVKVIQKFIIGRGVQPL
jgi:hypothetical protein